MRASLFASAMATTLNGRRARSCVSQGYFSGFCLARRSTECLVGAGEERRRHLGAQRSGGFEVDHEVEPCRLLNRKVRWLGTFEDAVHEIGRASIQSENVRS